MVHFVQGLGDFVVGLLVIIFIAVFVVITAIEVYDAIKERKDRDV